MHCGLRSPQAGKRSQASKTNNIKTGYGKKVGSVKTKALNVYHANEQAVTA